MSGRPAMARHEARTLVVRELVAEHGVLSRRLAQLQQRVGDQLQASARRQATLSHSGVAPLSGESRFRAATICAGQIFKGIFPLPTHRLSRRSRPVPVVDGEPGKQRIPIRDAV